MRIVLYFLLLIFLGACDTDSVIGKPEIKPIDTIQEKPKEIKNSFINPQVDIIFVVDDSYSMDDHQRNLSQNIDQFAKHIFKNKLLDFHIGVISSTESYKGRLKGDFIHRNTPDLEVELKRQVVVGTNGSGTEKFFETLLDSFDPRNQFGPNIGFYRKDAYIAVIFISDTGPSDDISAQDLYTSLLTIKGNQDKKILSFAAIVPPHNPLGCPVDYEWKNDLYKFIDFLSLTRGTHFDLCTPDFGSKLAGIGEDLVSRIDFTVPLERIPVLDTIVVKYGTQVIPRDFHKGWTYDPELVALRMGRELKLEDQPDVKGLDISFKPAQEISE